MLQTLKNVTLIDSEKLEHEPPKHNPKWIKFEQSLTEPAQPMI